MLLPSPDGVEAEEFERRTRFAMKFQQFTGPVQAKGVEDTAFYRYGPLLSLNEVGGDPSRFGQAPSAFHDANRDRLQNWPLAMIATSTHDTKRGEDARARLNVLSELPQTWREMIFQWARINASARTIVNGEPAPDRSDEYFYYQAVIGAWPADSPAPDREFVGRIQEYMAKATREKKVHTSWINPSRAYDDAVSEFVEKTLHGTRSQHFLRGFLPFVKKIARFGMVNSLAQVTLKIVSPGVPDFYQGSELWDLSLVDPDNRRPANFNLRRRMLEAMLPLLDESASPDCVSAGVTEMLKNWEDGRIKQYVTAAGLRLRRKNRALFLDGEYYALNASGGRSERVVALGRAYGPDVLVAIVPCLTASLAEEDHWLPLGDQTWGNTAIEIPAAWSSLSFRDLLTGNVLRAGGSPYIRIADTLRICPVALLVGRQEAS
jgi:(1->4)-alpha-D-glucan 1-alpha-D-glucosylmutase